MATKPKAKFELTAKNKSGRAIRQVDADLARMAGELKFNG